MFIGHYVLCILLISIHVIPQLLQFYHLLNPSHEHTGDGHLHILSVNQTMVECLGEERLQSIQSDLLPMPNTLEMNSILAQLNICLQSLIGGRGTTGECTLCKYIKSLLKHFASCVLGIKCDGPCKQVRCSLIVHIYKVTWFICSLFTWMIHKCRIYFDKMARMT